MPENKTDTSSTVSSENNEDFSVTFASNVNSDGEEVAILTSEEKAKHWMEEALQSFDPTNKQYSVYLNEQSGEAPKLTIEDIKRLAKNAQSDLNKILKINSLVRQEINEDDIIGKVYEAVVANLNANVRISFDNLPQKHTKKLKNEAEKLIKRFHKETNINQILSSSIPTVYTEGNCIKYLREKNGHYVVDTYPLGVAIVSDYNVNGNPYILIDIRELTSRLQKTTIKGRKK